MNLKGEKLANPALTATGLSPGGYAAEQAKIGYNERRVRGKIARRVTQSLGRCFMPGLFVSERLSTLCSIDLETVPFLGPACHPALAGSA